MHNYLLRHFEIVSVLLFKQQKKRKTFV